MEFVYYIALPFAIFFALQLFLCLKVKSLRIRLIPLFVSVFLILLGLINLTGESNPLPVDAAAISGLLGSIGIACLFGCGCGWVFGIVIKKMRS